MKMKHLIPMIALLATTSLYATPQSADLKGQATFVSDAPVEKIEGTGDATGTFSVDFADLSSLKAELKVPVASMKTGNTTRDDHMRNAEWLEADKCADISFVVKSTKAIKSETQGEVTEHQVEVSGDFTVHCISKPLTVPASIKVKGDKMKISTKFEVSLADFDIKGKAGVVGEKVGKSIAVATSLNGVLK
jgi:polyisoprenoid-binding protein YceI